MIRLIGLFILILFSQLSNAVELQRQDFNGTTYIRVMNDTSLTINCLIIDAYGAYYPFWLYPQSFGRWYIVRGKYQWSCVQ